MSQLKIHHRYYGVVTERDMYLSDLGEDHPILLEHKLDACNKCSKKQAIDLIYLLNGKYGKAFLVEIKLIQEYNIKPSMPFKGDK